MKRKSGQLQARLVLAAAAMIVLPSGLAAQGEDESRWRVFVGGFFPDVESSFQTSDPEEGVGELIRLEDDLGLDDSADALRLNLAYRMGGRRRHVLEFQYLQIDRDGRVTVEDDIEFGEEVFPASADVATSVKTEDFDIHYTYMLVANEKGFFGISAGVHGIRVDARARGTFSVAGGPAEALEQEAVDEEFPLPLFGIRGAYFFSDRWSASGGFKWLDLTVGDIDGGFIDAWLRLEFGISKAVSLGAGYAVIDVDFDREPSKKRAGVKAADYEYSGPEIFLRFKF